MPSTHTADHVEKPPFHRHDAGHVHRKWINSLHDEDDAIRKCRFSLHEQAPFTAAPVLGLLETREVWAALAEAHRHLAELKGLCESLPNQAILLDTLGIQEAKDSSEIENIITTHDQLFASQEDAAVTPAAKEVRHYVSALRKGYEAARQRPDTAGNGARRAGGAGAAIAPTAQIAGHGFEKRIDRAR